MASFSYVVKDSKGNKHEGTVTAVSLDAALNKLRESGNTVISVVDTRQAKQTTRGNLFDAIILYIHKKRTAIPLRNLVFFTRQLATMFSAGLTIEKSLNNLLYEEGNRKFKKVIAELLNDVKKGFSLSDAMDHHPGVFSPLYVALVKSGEISGSLASVLEELADYLEFIQDTRRKVISALSYPFFVVTILLILAVFLVVKIVPMFQDVYSRFGAELPYPTQVLIMVSETIRYNFFVSLIGFLFLIALIIITNLTYTGKYIFDKVKLIIPIFKNLIINSTMSKMSRTFGMLLGAGVPVVDTMGLVHKVIDNMHYQKAIKQAIGYIRDGYSIAASLKKTDVFPNTLLSLTSTGEETGEIEKMLAKAADYYDKQLEAVVSRLTSLIEPMLIVLIAVVIGTIVVVIYLPIFHIGTALRKGLQ
ncbi:MAG: pilus assembly protein PilC [candidate division Zixibacteria bacterium 4484_95]|nr:MAG: pilus assembly protein PilC [candidate division Zixibacteria bacterium 4484_95]RKX18405.1 MAG: type II secretion system F family protein [candidate division Zixibacteria bacterium]